MQRFNENVINDNGKMLIAVCAQNELRINNTLYANNSTNTPPGIQEIKIQQLTTS